MMLSLFNTLVIAFLSAPQLQLDQVQPTAAELQQRESDKEKAGGENDGSWSATSAQEAADQPKKLDSRWQYWSNIPR
ncbi:MAG TPA: hypothetical protein VD886_10570 [Herpetosiphonaceae bacterium]|nr:hypothetical protein [Herpetosiphonaceae bacterium]